MWNPGSCGANPFIRFIFTVVDWTMVRGLSMSMLWNSCECAKLCEELTQW